MDGEPDSHLRQTDISTATDPGATEHGAPRYPDDLGTLGSCGILRDQQCKPGHDLRLQWLSRAHLLPLMVAVGAAVDDPAERVYHESDFMGASVFPTFDSATPPKVS